MSSRAWSQTFRLVDCTPTCITLPVSRHTFATSIASSTVFVIGFSANTCLPARSASTIWRWCQWSGVPMQTASTSLSASMSV